MPFIVDASGPDGFVGVFEDDGDTGYLYIYSPAEEKIERNLHVYDRGGKVNVSEADVSVVWSNDLSKCGVLIWGEMRGIIDLKNGREGRAWIESRRTRGIDDSEWLSGFDVD